MRPRLTILVIAAMVTAACGGDSGAVSDPPDATDDTSTVSAEDGDGRSAGEAEDVAAPGDESCDLTTPEVVAASFEATSATETPEISGAGDPICFYALTDGLIPRLVVRHRGSSDDWESLRSEHQTPPLGEDRHVFEELSGIGDDAFYYRTSVVVSVGVRQDPTQFTLFFLIGDVRPPVTGQQLDEAITSLARAIADG